MNESLLDILCKQHYATLKSMREKRDPSSVMKYLGFLLDCCAILNSKRLLLHQILQLRRHTLSSLNTYYIDTSKFDFYPLILAFVSS